VLVRKSREQSGIVDGSAREAREKIEKQDAYGLLWRWCGPVSKYE